MNKQRLQYKVYVNGSDTVEIITNLTFDEACKLLEDKYNENTRCIRYEKTKHADGNRSVSIKNYYNKILFQYKEL